MVTSVTFIVIAGFIAIWCGGIYIPQYIYNRYKGRNNGREFFIYEGRKDVGIYINDNIVPLLKPEVEVGLIIKKSQEVFARLGWTVIPMALKEVESCITGKGYPIVMKVSNGKMLCRSLNVELYRTIHKGEEPERFLSKINEALDELREIAEHNHRVSDDN